MPPVAAKKKTLGEQLADLANPIPKDSFDPEDIDAENPRNVHNSDDEHDPQAATAHYLDVGRSKLRKAASIVDAKYRGKKSSRKALEEDSGGFEGSVIDDDADIDDSDDSEEGKGEMADGQEENDSDDVDSVEANESVDDDEGDDDDDDDEDENDDEDDEENEFSSSAPKDQSDEEDASLKAELKAIEEEEKSLLTSMSRSAQTDVDKGKHVRVQLSCWDTLLDCRIRIQKIVNGVNRLPQHNTLPSFLLPTAPLREENANLLSDAKCEIRDLMEDLLDLRSDLMSSGNMMELPTEKLSALNKRKWNDMEEPDLQYAEHVWSNLDAFSSTFAPYRNETLEKWSSKIQVAASGPTKKLKSFDQSVVTQISQALADRPKLLTRTRLMRSDYQRIGVLPEKDAASEKENVINEHLKNTNAEVFDDADFYQQMLRELIESRVTNDDDPIAQGLRWTKMQTQMGKIEKKHRAGVDVRASKGRKIKYQVQEPLISFMAPIHYDEGAWSEERVEELYASLLGKRVEVEKTDRDDDEPAEVMDVGLDGLKLFG